MPGTVMQRVSTVDVDTGMMAPTLRPGRGTLPSQMRPEHLPCWQEERGGQQIPALVNLKLHEEEGHGPFYLPSAQ